MKPEEIVAKHLEAIGKKETRNAMNTQIVLGDVKYKFFRRGDILTGKSVMASDGQNNLLLVEFNHPSYVSDKFSFDGKNVGISFAIPGTRSALGEFLKSYGEILRYGLLGGTLSTSWVLEHTDSNSIKLGGGDTKKINDKECYVVELKPKKGSDLTIKLYFDAQNFQHVRTSYERVISARMGAVATASASQLTQRNTMVEEFGDYRAESGLILPHSYRIHYIDDLQNGTFEYEWVFTLNQFTFNQKVDHTSFSEGT